MLNDPKIIALQDVLKKLLEELSGKTVMSTIGLGTEKGVLHIPTADSIGEVIGNFKRDLVDLQLEMMTMRAELSAMAQILSEEQFEEVAAGAAERLELIIADLQKPKPKKTGIIVPKGNDLGFGGAKFGRN